MQIAAPYELSLEEIQQLSDSLNSATFSSRSQTLRRLAESSNETSKTRRAVFAALLAAARSSANGQLDTSAILTGLFRRASSKNEVTALAKFIDELELDEHHQVALSHICGYLHLSHVPHHPFAYEAPWLLQEAPIYSDVPFKFLRYLWLDIRPYCRKLLKNPKQALAIQAAAVLAFLDESTAPFFEIQLEPRDPMADVQSRFARELIASVAMKLNIPDAVPLIVADLMPEKLTKEDYQFAIDCVANDNRDLENALLFLGAPCGRVDFLNSLLEYRVKLGNFDAATRMASVISLNGERVSAFLPRMIELIDLLIQHTLKKKGQGWDDELDESKEPNCIAMSTDGFQLCEAIARIATATELSSEKFSEELNGMFQTTESRYHREIYVFIAALMGRKNSYLSNQVIEGIIQKRSDFNLRLAILALPVIADSQELGPVLEGYLDAGSLDDEILRSSSVKALAYMHRESAREERVRICKKIISKFDRYDDHARVRVVRALVTLGAFDEEELAEAIFKYVPDTRYEYMNATHYCTLSRLKSSVPKVQEKIASILEDLYLSEATRPHRIAEAYLHEYYPERLLPDSDPPLALPGDEGPRKEETAHIPGWSPRNPEARLNATKICEQQNLDELWQTAFSEAPCVSASIIQFLRSKNFQIKNIAEQELFNRLADLAEEAIQAEVPIKECSTFPIPEDFSACKKKLAANGRVMLVYMEENTVVWLVKQRKVVSVLPSIIEVVFRNDGEFAALICEGNVVVMNMLTGEGVFSVEELPSRAMLAVASESPVVVQVSRDGVMRVDKSGENHEFKVEQLVSEPVIVPDMENMSINERYKLLNASSRPVLTTNADGSIVAYCSGKGTLYIFKVPGGFASCCPSFKSDQTFFAGNHFLSSLYSNVKVHGSGAEFSSGALPELRTFRASSDSGPVLGMKVSPDFLLLSDSLGSAGYGFKILELLSGSIRLLYCTELLHVQRLDSALSYSENLIVAISEDKIFFAYPHIDPRHESLLRSLEQLTDTRLDLDDPNKSQRLQNLAKTLPEQGWYQKYMLAFARFVKEIHAARDEYLDFRKAEESDTTDSAPDGTSSGEISLQSSTQSDSDFKLGMYDADSHDLWSTMFQRSPKSALDIFSELDRRGFRPEQAELFDQIKKLVPDINSTSQDSYKRKEIYLPVSDLVAGDASPGDDAYFDVPDSLPGPSCTYHNSGELISVWDKKTIKLFGLSRPDAPLMQVPSIHSQSLILGDGPCVGTADENGQLQIWNCNEGLPTYAVPLAEKHVKTRIADFGKVIVQASEDGTIHYWREGQLEGKWQSEPLGHRSYHSGCTHTVHIPPGLAVSSDGKYIALSLSSEIKQMSLHDAKSGNCLGRFTSTEGSVTCMEFWDEHLLVRAGRVRCFNTSDLSEVPAGIPITDYPGPSWEILPFSSDGTMLAVPGMNDGLMIYDRHNSESIELPFRLENFSFHPDNSSLICFSAHQGARLYQFFPNHDYRHEKLEKELKTLFLIPQENLNARDRKRIETLPKSGWYQKHLLARAKFLKLLQSRS